MIEDKEIIQKLCEYLSIAPYLTEFSPDSQYQRANQLAMELAVWLPPELYKHIGKSIAQPSEKCNPGTVIEEARRLYNGNKESIDLSRCFISHSPGIGKNKSKDGHRS